MDKSIIADFTSLNSHIDDTNFIKLLKKGYSKKTINNIFEHLNEKELSRSIHNFYSGLSDKLTYDLKDKLLNTINNSYLDESFLKSFILTHNILQI